MSSAETNIPGPRWLWWILFPVLWVIMLPLAAVIMIPLGLLALLSIPYFAIYPDHHKQIWDYSFATDRQKELVARWRAGYRRLGFLGRVRRAVKVFWRNQRKPASFEPVSWKKFVRKLEEQRSQEGKAQ